MATAKDANMTFEEIVPPAGWTTDKDGHYLLVLLPGFSKEHMKIQLVNSEHIRISGKRLVNENKQILFDKYFNLPENSNPDKITAKFEAQILFVTVPKQVVDEEKSETIAKNENISEEKPKDDDNKHGGDQSSQSKKKEEYGGDQSSQSKKKEEYGGDQSSQSKKKEEYGGDQSSQSKKKEEYGGDQSSQSKKKEEYGGDHSKKEEEYGGDQSGQSKKEEEYGGDQSGQSKKKEVYGGDQSNQSKKKEESCHGNAHLSFPEECLRKMEGEASNFLKKITEILRKNKGSIATAILGFSIGVLFSRKFDREETL